MAQQLINQAYHEGCLLYIQRKDTRLVLAEDVTLTEACELMLGYKGTRVIAPVVRKTLRRKTGVGWPNKS